MAPARAAGRAPLAPPRLRHRGGRRCKDLRLVEPSSTSPHRTPSPSSPLACIFSFALNNGTPQCGTEVALRNCSPASARKTPLEQANLGPMRPNFKQYWRIGSAKLDRRRCVPTAVAHGETLAPPCLARAPGLTRPGRPESTAWAQEGLPHNYARATRGRSNVGFACCPRPIP